MCLFSENPQISSEGCSKSPFPSLDASISFETFLHCFQSVLIYILASKITPKSTWALHDAPKSPQQAPQKPLGSLHSCPTPQQNHQSRSQDRPRGSQAGPERLETVPKSTLDLPKCRQQPAFAIQTHSDSFFKEIDHFLKSFRRPNIEVNSVYSTQTTLHTLVHHTCPRNQKWPALPPYSNVRSCLLSNSETN